MNLLFKVVSLADFPYSHLISAYPDLALLTAFRNSLNTFLIKLVILLTYRTERRDREPTYSRGLKSIKHFLYI